MITGLFKILIIIMIIVGLLYAVTCVYANFMQKGLGEYKTPSIGEAKYEFTIRNTGNVLYTDIYSTRSAEFTLIGYWERVDNKYEYRPGQLVIDKKIYGVVTIRKR